MEEKFFRHFLKRYKVFLKKMKDDDANPKSWEAPKQNRAILDELQNLYVHWATLGVIDFPLLQLHMHHREDWYMGDLHCLRYKMAKQQGMYVFPSYSVFYLLALVARDEQTFQQRHEQYPVCLNCSKEAELVDRQRLLMVWNCTKVDLLRVLLLGLHLDTDKHDHPEQVHWMNNRYAFRIAGAAELGLGAKEN